MSIRRWVLTPPVIALVVLCAVAFVPVLAQQQGQKVDKKVEKAQQFDIQSVVGATEAAMAGQPATDIKMTFRNDALKAQEGKRQRENRITFENGKAVYRPTMHYAYCPSDAAIASPPRPWTGLPSSMKTGIATQRPWNSPSAPSPACAAPRSTRSAAPRNAAPSAR